MAKKHTGRGGRAPRRAIHRSATRRGAPRRTEHPAEDDPRDQPLIQGLRQTLRDDPLTFVLSVSSLLTALDVDAAAAGEGTDMMAPTLAELVESFLETDIAETTAALHVMAALTDDELVAARIRRELPSRRQPVPGQVLDLPDARVRSAALMHDELGDGENVFLDLRWTAGPRATVVVYIDHAVGTRIKDAFAVSEPMEAMLERYRELIAEGRDRSELEAVDLADARATLETALVGVRHVEGDPEDTWPGSRPFVEMLVRSLPEGGTPYAGSAAYGPVAPEDVLRDFLASPEAAGLDLDEEGAQVDAARVLVGYAAQWSGHPLRWSARTVEVALAEKLAQNPSTPKDTLDAVPEVLRSLIRYSHRVTGTGQRSHQDTMEAVRGYTPEFDRVRQLGAADDDLGELD